MDRMESGRELHDDLVHAVRRLYETFSRYRERAGDTGDDLRALAPADFAPIAAAVLRGAVPTDEVKRVLPRILEVLSLEYEGVDDDADDEPLSIGVAIWYAAMAEGNLPEWPAAEQEAVRTFTVAYWRWLLENYPRPGVRPVSFLYCIALIEADLGGYLRIWAQSASLPAIRHLGELLMGDMMYIITTGGKLRKWRERPVQTDQVVAWLTGEELASRVESAFFARGNDPEAAEIAAVADQLRALRAALWRAR